MNLRRWLRRDPRPHAIRCDGAQVVPVPTVGQVWAQLEETLTALAPSKLEALDSAGAVLRAVVLETDDAPSSATSSSPSSSGTELATIARIIADAHDAGARRHAEAYGLAFSENTKLVGLLAQRLAGLETAWQKAMAQVAQAQADAAAAASSGDDATSAITAMLGGMMQAPPPNVTPIAKVKP